MLPILRTGLGTLRMKRFLLAALAALTLSGCLTEEEWFGDGSSAPGEYGDWGDEEY